MNRRSRLAPSWQILCAGAAGGVLGVVLARKHAGPGTLLVRQLCEFGGVLFLTWWRALAIPMVVSTIVLGSVGLEPMRALSKLLRRTTAWMVGSSVAAVAVGAVAAFAVHPVIPASSHADPADSFARLPEGGLDESLAWGWLGLVLVCLGFGYYRNQIDEGHGRMVTRFCQGLEEMVAPLLRWTLRLAPFGVFLLVAVRVVQQRANFQHLGLVRDGHIVAAMLAGWLFYGFGLLPLALWTLGRVNPWRFLRTMVPAMLAALTSGSPEVALPLTLGNARRAGISSRVAGATLPLPATLHRDGQALGWTVLMLVCWRQSTVPGLPMVSLFCVLAAAWLVGVGAGALTTRTGTTWMLFSGVTGISPTGLLLAAVLERLVTLCGAAVSVWSQACAAAIIARGEGEYWVPGPPPDPDELQGLKNDLELAEG